MRRIAVITGTRAEYGLLYWIIKEIHEDPNLELQLIVTGMHLSPEFGMTVRVIENDGFPIAERVEMLLSADTATAISTSMGLGMIGFAKAYARLSPDMITVLGDRFEIFSAAAAAIPFRIPIAHIHGGESTEGVMDESLRHAITKMSHIHFCSTELYRNRIIQMGENPENVFCYGAPGLDNIHRLKLMSRKDLFKELRIEEKGKVGIVTYHPAAHEHPRSVAQIENLLSALKRFPNIVWVITYPNADTGGRIFVERIEEFSRHRASHVKVFASLGQQKYLSLLRHSEIMVGNSSSGIIEAPSFGLPVVNIGSRQEGRVRAGNVLDLPECEENRVAAAIKKALSPMFRKSLQRMLNPYGSGTGNTSQRIVHTLKEIKIDNVLLVKRFHDVFPSAV